MKRIIKTITLFFMIPWATIVPMEQATVSTAIAIPVKAVASPTPAKPTVSAAITVAAEAKTKAETATNQTVTIEEIDFPQETTNTQQGQALAESSWTLSFWPSSQSSSEISLKKTDLTTTVFEFLAAMKTHQRVKNTLKNEAAINEFILTLEKENSFENFSKFVELATEKNVPLSTNAHKTLLQKAAARLSQEKQIARDSMKKLFASVADQYETSIKSMAAVVKVCAQLNKQPSKILPPAQDVKDMLTMVEKRIFDGPTKPDTQQPQPPKKA